MTDKKCGWKENGKLCGKPATHRFRYSYMRYCREHALMENALWGGPICYKMREKKDGEEAARNATK